MRLHVGAAMWTHPAWRLPAGLTARERLRAYASWCTAVEGNTTFYATPGRDTVRSWVEQTPPDFRFLLKLPRTITHERRLLDTDSLLRDFVRAIEPLGSRVHALWIQLPPSFGLNDLRALADFLARAPREFAYAVEVRDRAFFERPQWLSRVLDEVGAEWVTFDTTVLFESPPESAAEQEAWEKKPRLPRRAVALTDHPVVRYIGRDDPEKTATGWAPWVDTAVEWLNEGRSPTVFIHTPDNVDAPELARRFHADVRARLPELEPLPEPLPIEPLTLF